MSNLESIRAKVRALLAKTVDAGCTESEAMAAAAKAGELMALYQITATETEVKAERCITVVIDGGSGRSPTVDVIPAVARFCDCRVWSTKTPCWTRGARATYTVKYSLFGLPDDAHLAEYLIRAVGSAMRSEVAAFKLTPEYQRAYAARTASTSFLHGMSSRVAARLDEMRRARNPASGAPGQAMVVVKNAVVREQFAALGLRLTKRAPVTRTNGDARAFGAGMEAGNRVSLNRPLSAPAGQPSGSPLALR